MKTAGARSSNDKMQIQAIARAAVILRALEDEAVGLSLDQATLKPGAVDDTARIVAVLETEKFLITISRKGESYE